MSLLSALNWYQKKIGTYDKELWEKTVDQRISEGLFAVPKKNARVKTELIDVDLVRGSAFPKAKPQHNWIAASLAGIMRILLLPFYFMWWKLQTHALVSWALVSLYILQLLSIYLYYSASDDDFSDVPTSEAIMPVAMMLVLGVLHSQIVATFSTKSSHKPVTRTKRKKIRHKFRKRPVAECNKKSPQKSLNQLNSYKCFHSSGENGMRCVPTEDCIANSPAMHHNDNKAVMDGECNVDAVKSAPVVDKSSTFSDYISSHVTKSMGSMLCCHHVKQISADHKHIETIKDLHKDNSLSENGSSGEEYFIARKRLYNSNEWGKYIYQLKPNSMLTEHDCSNKYTSYAFSCSGDNPSSVSNDLSDSKSMPKECSEYPQNSCDSFQQKKGGKIVILQTLKNVPYRNSLISCASEFNKPYAHNHHLPMQKDMCYSSGESGPDSASPNRHLSTSDIEWPIMNDCLSDSSDITAQSSHEDESDASTYENPFAWEIQEISKSSFNAGCDSSNKGSETRAVSCTIWQKNECKKVDLSVLDISSAIIRKVDASVYSTEYLAMGLLLATVIGVLPLLFRLQSGASIDTIQDVTFDVINFTVPSTDYIMQIWQDMITVMIGTEWRVQSVVLIAVIERFTLSLAYFFLLSVAEKTFKQRFLYAKHFSYLTSSRRARRTDLPHFRLNKVRNIKTWLSVRSYLKKLGPQRSVDVTVSMTFILEVCVLSLLCVQLLKETGQFASKLQSWETLFWTLALGFYLLRFMIIGSKINKKYRNLSVLITEQINLYLHMEQKPHKKEELMLANSVLKLAADLLKELESPFKISGLCANPYLYNITKVVVLSAFSAVLTEVLGFKLKLYKIKMH